MDKEMYKKSLLNIWFCKTYTTQNILDKGASVCKFLLEYYNIKSPKDDFGDTPLHLAAAAGLDNICKLLLKYVEDKTWTSLLSGHLASKLC